MSKRNTQEYNSLYHNHLTKGGIMTTSIDPARPEQVSIETLQKMLKHFVKIKKEQLKRLMQEQKKMFLHSKPAV